MKNLKEEEQFRNALEVFYLNATKQNPLKYTLKNRMKKMVDNAVKEWDLVPDVELRSIKPKMPTSYQTPKEPINEYSSLRWTERDKKSNNQLSVSQSRSKLSKSAGSSRDISDNQAKMFGCDWLYNSDSQVHTILFGIMSALIVTGNKFAFKYFEVKVNDLIPNYDFSQLELVAIAHNWQRIGDLLAQSQSLRWQKMLRESVEKFPLAFADLTCRCMLRLDKHIGPQLSLSEELLTLMASELKIEIHYFAINFREIETNKVIGKQGKEINIGLLGHCNRYVVSNRAPDYRKEDLQMRALNSSFKDILSSTINTYDNHCRNYQEFSDLVKGQKEKETTAQEHFKHKMAEVNT